MSDLHVILQMRIFLWTHTHVAYSYAQNSCYDFFPLKFLLSSSRFCKRFLVISFVNFSFLISLSFIASNKLPMNTHLYIHAYTACAQNSCYNFFPVISSLIPFLILQTVSGHYLQYFICPNMSGSAWWIHYPMVVYNLSKK